MNNYLIPANSKKSALILGLFKGTDLIILVTGIVMTLLLYIIIGYGGDASDTKIIIIEFLPTVIACIMICPIPYYHNVATFLKEFYLFQTSPKVYKWKGWCATSEFSETNKH